MNRSLMMSLKSLCIATSILAGLGAAANEITMVTVTSDAIEGVLSMNLTLNQDGDIASLKYIAPNSTEVFDIAKLPQGLLIMKYENHEVITLYSSNFDPKHGGTLRMNYLFNGINGTRHDFIMNLDRQGQDWNLYVDDSAGRRLFKSMFLKANKFLGQIIGIEKVVIK